MDGVAALPLGCSGISNKRKRTCSGPVAHDGFIYYSYDLLSYDDDDEDDEDDDDDDDDHDHDHDHDARGVMIRHDAAALLLMQRPCH